MTNVSKGQIYKIVCDATDEIYIGSTTQSLPKRLYCHKNSKSFGHTYSSVALFEKGNCGIALIENFPCHDKNELHARERSWIEQTPNTVNNAVPTRTRKENYEINREREIARASDWNKANVDKRRVKIQCGICGELKAKTVIRRHQQSIKCLSHKSPTLPHTNLEDGSPIVISGI